MITQFRLYELVQTLIGKQVTLIFSSSDDISGELVEVLPDVLVLSSGKKIAICSTANLNMICEGEFGA